MNKLEFRKIDSKAIREYKKKNFKRILKTLINQKFIVVGGLIVIILIIVGIFADFIVTHDPFGIDVPNRLGPPSKEHLFGTDNFGRDLFSRVIMGSRLSIMVGIIATGISTIIGSFLGLIAGYYGKWIDNVIMRFMDALFSIPSLILAIVFVSIMGPSEVNVFLAIAIIYIPIYARLVRGRVLVIKGEAFIEAESAIGQSNIKIIFSHILPNLLNVVIVESTAVFAEAITIQAALSFLGIGAPPPTPSWGAILFDAKNYLVQAPLFAIFPGLAISFSVLGFNLLGDGLRDVLDPRLSRTAV